jgi:hypothetical protein
LNSNSNFKTQRWDALEATDNEARETGTKSSSSLHGDTPTAEGTGTDPPRSSGAERQPGTWRNDGTGLDLFSGQN